MHDDDLPIGRILSRRDVLTLLGAGGAAILTGCGARSAEGTAKLASAASPCLVKPESTEGPFFFEGDLFRRDIRTDSATGRVSAGAPLALTIGVSSVEDGACVPLEGAIVNVWHCDAGGSYSGFEVEGTAGHDFLRGFQRTDAAGEVSFVTVYPGWYPGRAVHIHLKVRTSEEAEAYEFTSQLYFPDALSDEVFARDAYARSSGRRRLNEEDGLFTRGQGSQLLLAPRPEGDGYAARFDFGLDLSDTAVGARDRFRRRG